MIIWLLSHLSAFRDCRAEAGRLAMQLNNSREALQSASTEKLILQDRLDAVIEDRAKLWQLTRQCIDNERSAYQCQINAQWQKQGFGAPYPEAHTLPGEAVTPLGGGTVGRQTAQTPSSRVAKATADFIKEYALQSVDQ